MNSWDLFVERLQQLQMDHQSDVALLIKPVFEQLPLPITRHDDPFFPFSRAVVNATSDLVCAYVFDMAAYMAMGAAGAVALERSIRYAGRDHLTILHAPFTGIAYSPMADATGFGVDAVTLTRSEDLTHYLQFPPYAAFLLDYGMDDHEVPEDGGLYSIYQQKMRFHTEDGSLLTLRVTDEDLLTVGKLEDYADRIRETVEAFRG